MNSKVTVIEIRSKVEEYHNKTSPYLKHVIKNIEKSNKWKIQLTIANNLIFSIDNDDEWITFKK